MVSPDIIAQFNEIKICNTPHIVEGFKLEMSQLQMAKLPSGPRIDIPTAYADKLEEKIF